jgi:hypothetical protein
MTGILMRQNESKYSSLLVCGRATGRIIFDILKDHTTRLQDPEDEGITILHCQEPLTP